MELEGKRGDLNTLLESIKSTTSVEERIALLEEVREFCKTETETVDVVAVVDCLSTIWKESTYTDISQCRLNKGILQLATNYLESNYSCCLSLFTSLAVKVSLWSRKYIEVATTSAEDFSQEANSSLYLQMVLDSLSFSSSTVLQLTRSPFLEEEAKLLTVENFILELMNLIKVTIAEIKKIHSIAAAVLKMVPVILDSAVKLSRAYSDAVKHDQLPINGERLNCRGHVFKISTSIVHGLYELGVLAASGGGILVTVLSASWKGVVTLLQFGKGVFSEQINVGDIISTTVALATDSLRFAVETWSSRSAKEDLTLAEAKRALLPVKFYLINAVRISSEYPCEALDAAGKTINCVLLISYYTVSFSKGNHLKAASGAISEVLEQTSFFLLFTVLNSACVKHELKLQMLNTLFTDESNLGVVHSDIIQNFKSSNQFLNDGYDFGTDGLKLERVMLFLNILKFSTHLQEEILLEISRKLVYLFSCLSSEDVYASILILHVPLSSAPGETQPLLHFLLHCLQTFMIVASSSDLVWVEMEYFLLDNFFNPHALCLEIIIDLWCFLIHHADQEMMHGALDSLCSLVKNVALSEPDLTPFSALRKMARSITSLVTSAPQAAVDYVYNLILGTDGFDMSSTVHMAMLMEGFPVNSISFHLKNNFLGQITNAFLKFVEGCQGKLSLLDSRIGKSHFLGQPVHALSHVLRSSQFDSCGIFENHRITLYLKLTVSVIHECSNAIGGLKYYYLELLGAMLDIISKVECFYASDKIGQVVVELRDLFATDASGYSTAICQCKVSLTSFMAGIAHMEMEEGDASNVCSALWDLFHMLLKERNWAFIHLALTAFVHFTAGTSCNQLWRFVPADAALAFDMETGKKACEERFMSELKSFLEKEMALGVITSCEEQLDLLTKEGELLKEQVKKLVDSTSEMAKLKDTDLDLRKQTIGKKRKLSNSISEGLALLHGGVKVLADALASDDSGEFRHLSDQLSCLEETVSQLCSLSKSCDALTSGIEE